VSQILSPLSELLLPPLNVLLLALCALALWRRRRALARGLAIAALALLWLSSTPAVGALLLRALQTSPALPAAGPWPTAQAIVVLSAEMERSAPEYAGAQRPGPLTMDRLRYAAFLHRQTGLPLLVSGGQLESYADPHAATMRAHLEHDLGIPVRWSEERSRDTFENAQFSAATLLRDGVRRVLLVTHAWHMPRARAAFERFGLEVVPAPTGFRGAALAGIRDLVPRWTALRDCALALHELIGIAWYAIAR
jgi:uncharacterized SAM-binding protein YcdF (DUF218 family)